MKNKKIVPGIIALTLSVLTVAAMATFAMNAKLGKNVGNLIVPESVADIAKKTQKKEIKNNKTTTAPITTAPQTTAPATTVPETTVEETTQPVTEAPAAGNEIERAAREAVSNCTNSNMTKEEKLKAAFDYLKKNYLEGVNRNDYREMDWPAVYAKDLLIGGKGDCFSYGAAFAYMAKAIGYEESYACNSGGHGWAEVNGKVYDPEWSMHSQKYSYFGMSYDEPCDVAYKGALGTADWMHVKV